MGLDRSRRSVATSTEYSLRSESTLMSTTYYKADAFSRLLYRVVCRLARRREARPPWPVAGRVVYGSPRVPSSFALHLNAQIKAFPAVACFVCQEVGAGSAYVSPPAGFLFAWEMREPPTTCSTDRVSARESITIQYMSCLAPESRALAAVIQSLCRFLTRTELLRPSTLARCSVR